MSRRGVMSDQKMFLAVLSVVIGLDNVVTLVNLVTLAMKMEYSEDDVETAILNAFTRVRNLDMALSVESLELMAQMHILGNIPSDSSLTSALLACANIGDVEVQGTDTFSFIQSRVPV
ncbi:hypothetical protein CQW23_23640 [Capsicum baccatum]|uniref:Uncharacterized protein n=1 Tax=Capsicum baccatum TaxID=33114 RepID=A0A2G2VSI4_CAPBA|nr:hypothetical protein CQW23_23640 [Capsicum baccatum]